MHHPKLRVGLLALLILPPKSFRAPPLAAFELLAASMTAIALDPVYTPVLLYVTTSAVNTDFLVMTINWPQT